MEKFSLAFLDRISDDFIYLIILDNTMQCFFGTVSIFLLLDLKVTHKTTVISVVTSFDCLLAENFGNSLLKLFFFFSFLTKTYTKKLFSKSIFKQFLEGLLHYKLIILRIRRIDIRKKLHSYCYTLNESFVEKQINFRFS